MVQEGYLVSTVAHFRCDSGYRLSEPSQESRSCERSGQWSGETQTCIEGTDSIQWLTDKTILRLFSICIN